MITHPLPPVSYFWHICFFCSLAVGLELNEESMWFSATSLAAICCKAQESDWRYSLPLKRGRKRKRNSAAKHQGYLGSVRGRRFQIVFQQTSRDQRCLVVPSPCLTHCFEFSMRLRTETITTLNPALLHPKTVEWPLWGVCW